MWSGSSPSSRTSEDSPEELGAGLWLVGEELATAVAPACPPREARGAQSSSKPTCPWITSNENGPGLDFGISSEEVFFCSLGFPEHRSQWTTANSVGIFRFRFFRFST